MAAKAASVLSLRYLCRSSSSSLHRARLLRTERRLASTVRRERPALTLWPSEEVSYDQPMIGDGPRTVSGKRPTAAALRLEREYLDWSAVPPSRDDVVQDYDAFMAERRETAEREREQKRKEARHARGLLRKPARQGARYGLPGPKTGYAPQPRPPRLRTHLK